MQRAGFTKAAVVTPHDTNPQVTTFTVKALYVGGTGHVTAIMADGVSVLISAVPAGTILPISVDRVMATGTTATLIVALGD